MADSPPDATRRSLTDSDFTHHPEHDTEPTEFTTGLPAVDDNLGGGLPAGTAVALSYPTASAGERLAYAQAVHPTHPTVYATTGHDTALLEGDLAAEHDRYHPDHSAGSNGSGDHAVDVVSLTNLENADAPSDANKRYAGLLEHPASCLPHWTGGSIVVDSITDYPASDLRRHLGTFTQFLRETNSIAYLIVHTNADTRTDRRRITTDVADAVFDYQRSDTDQGNDTLRIPKLRHPPKNAPELPITIDLNVGNTVSVSTGKSH